MPLLSAFTPAGQLRCSSSPSYIEQFYKLLPSLWGSQLAFDVIPSYNEEKLYAVARMCGLMLAELEHAGNQANPLKAYDLLPLLELDFLVSPGPSDTVPTRQKNVAAAYLLSRGATAANVVALLAAAIGPAFLAYLPNPNGTQAIVTGAANNGAGSIRIFAANNYATNDKIIISGVVGTTEANGAGIVTAPTPSQFDLAFSTFTNTYVSGGLARRLPTVFPADPRFAEPGLFADVRQPAKMLRLVDPVAGVIGSSEWCAYHALDVSGVPQLTWTARSNFSLLQLLVPTLAHSTGFFYQCTTAGVSDSAEPLWPTTPGATVTDGQAVWTCASTIAPALVVGDQVVMDPGNTQQMETVTVRAVANASPGGSNTTPGYLYFQAAFSRSHDIGSPMTTGAVPYWWSTQRLNYAILTAAGATDAPTRNKVDTLLGKVLRAVSTWAVVQPSSITFSGGTVGPLSAGLPMGTTPIGTFPFTNSLVLNQAPAPNPFLPTNVSGCILWLRSDLGITQSANRVSMWADQSGHGNDFTAIGSKRPLYVAGSRPYLLFDGETGTGNGLLCSGFPALPQPFDYFVAFRLTNTAPQAAGMLVDFGATDAGRLFQVGNDTTLGTQFSLGTHATMNVDHYAEIIEAGGVGTFNLDGNLSASAANANAGTGGAGIGIASNTDETHLDGFIYEVVVYNVALSAADRASLNTYFLTPH